MKKILFISVSFFLAGAGVASAANKPVKTKPHLDDHVTRIVIDGMDCLVWKDKISSGNSSYAYSGLTCDWSMKERR